MTTAPSRTKNSRRESVSSSTTRVRKNSIANGNSMRPRANTISHVEGAAVGLLSGSNNSSRPSRHAHHPSLGGNIPSVPSLDNYRGTGADNRHHPASGLAKLDTAGLPVDFPDSLRTAPIMGSFDLGFGMNDMVIGQGSTVNPAQLHFNISPHGFGDTPASPYPPAFPNASAAQSAIEEDFKIDWMGNFDSTMAFAKSNESAVGSSPSAMSTGSPSGTSEAILDGSNHPSVTVTSGGAWPNPLLSQTQPAAHQQYAMDFTNFPDFSQPTDTVSPKSLSYSTSTPMNSMGGGPALSSMPSNAYHHMPTTNGTPSLPMYNSNPPPTTLSYTNSITDTTRQALMATLQQPSNFTNRRFSQQSIGSSMPSSGGLSSGNMFDANSYAIPSTYDLQRYIAAYVHYFHPHMPFLHIPTLDFSASEYASRSRSPGGHPTVGGPNIAIGGGCLILSMAAIGALYEFDTAASKELFESAKKMIQLYLEEKRRADMSAAINRANSGRDNSIQNTPLWLVQAMLLNVIYGHNCDDKTAADIASTHCAALISLARAAELTQYHPPENLPPDQLGYPPFQDVSGINSDMWAGHQMDVSNERRDWLHWKTVEERKRTLYAIFSFSSLLVSTYNHSPALTNSEIRLTLPCEEQLWAADSHESWVALGGAAAADQNAIEFSEALKTLLVAGQASHDQYGPTQIHGLSPSDLKPSTFGCLVLINALHNYLWETRQQHMGKQWTNQETEAMFIHIEPAFRAWQTAWSSNPTHSLERPNPYGGGPLSADSIPLLDLAYVRLYVNLGKSKEAFWQRDWNSMSDELAKAVQSPHHPDNSPGPDFVDENTRRRRDSIAAYGVAELSISGSPDRDGSLHGAAGPQIDMRPSRSEHLLRKAAFYAADSMCMANELGNTFAEFSSRELPIQTAICLFDCAQVLAEWVATVQERIGPYVGILGQDQIDYNQVPAVILLEDEDRKLIQKIQDILNSVEKKMKDTVSHIGVGMSESWNCLPSLVEGGYGTKIAFSAAYLLNNAGVWQGKGSRLNVCTAKKDTG